MTPFDLIGTERYRDSPFSVPCPHCGSVVSYQKDKTKAYPTNASEVAVDLAGCDPDVLQGTVFGECRCNNRECQEHVHFVGTFVTERLDDEPVNFAQKFIIKCFFPSVPLIQIPSATPPKVILLLKRSFATAFMDQSASGNLLRSAIEAILTEQKVARFNTSNGKRRRITLHDRIAKLPQALQPHKNELLAIKWIGNVASHDELDVHGLRISFQIIEPILESLYGTKRYELLKAVKRINQRKKP